MNVQVSKSFRQKATKAILSIFLFIATYILLIAFAVAITIACGYGGIWIISARPSLATIMLGIGLMGAGIFILIFLVKFIFAENKTDISHLIEVKKEEEPKLFALIEDIVQETGTDFPKKVYISSEVNASVFYNSSFWSMFFPVRKNLHVGLGLMNTVTVDEFKAIVAHEFGHFSQRSMKVGSYVYNVNKIIHNMLYDNSSYENMISKWAGISGYFSIFLFAGIKIVEAIQWVLKKIYNVVNLNYLALSREMEFHADEVAANVAGSKPLTTSLVRLEFASYALNNVLNYYSEKIDANIKPSNIFPQQFFVMSFWGEGHNLQFNNGLPEVSLNTKNKFNKSRLAFNDQWASHPSDEDRINRLNSLGIVKSSSNNDIGATLFNNTLETQQKVTAHLFSNVQYAGDVTDQAFEDFKAEFILNHTRNTFPKKYNNYFDDLQLPELDLESLNGKSYSNIAEEELFGQEPVDLVYDSIGLQNDLKALNSLIKGEFKVKSFDYDNKRYRKNNATQLVTDIEEKLQATRSIIEDNNKKIFSYYFTLAKQSGNAEEYKSRYSLYIDYNKLYDKLFAVVDDMYKTLSFVNQSTTYDVIKNNFISIKDKEAVFKQNITEMLNDSRYSKYIDTTEKESLEKYLSQEWVYFTNESYNDEALGVLYKALQVYNNIINNLQFHLKKNFLEFQAKLTEVVTG